MAGSLEGNKLVAAILTAGIIGVGSAVFAGILYHPHQLEEPVYRVEAAAPEGGGERRRRQPRRSRSACCWRPPAPRTARRRRRNAPPATASTRAAPTRSARTCGAWSTARSPSTRASAIRAALSEKKGQNWDYDHLNHFLTSPKAYAPGTKMSFAGISKDAERADVIAYLRSLADEPGTAAGRLSRRPRGR